MNFIRIFHKLPITAVHLLFELDLSEVNQVIRHDTKDFTFIDQFAFRNDTVVIFILVKLDLCRRSRWDEGNFSSGTASWINRSIEINVMT